MMKKTTTTTTLTFILELMYNEDFRGEFPLLSQYAIPLFDMEADDNPARMKKQSTRDGLLREIVQLKQSYGEPLKFESQNSVQKTELMPVGNDGVSGPLDTVFEKLGEEMAIESILKYLTERHQAKLLAELTKLKLIPKLLDE
jgi:hypothetical protein|mmetsp:Transcript_14704/g.30154  ORF Transcript_14704/g.30154 Transcript_14704/m.30154 type:complete len:143 (+) Transcript_14704:1053-1481(+)